MIKPELPQGTTCAIAGGGPAGMMLALLLARAGIDVTVLEKHPDFLRDFRGDTVHASTLNLIDELGLGPRFAAMPHNLVEQVTVDLGEQTFRLGDLNRLPGPHKHIAMAPQWDFLEMLATAAETEPTFHLRRSTEVTGLLRSGDRITGIEYRTASGETGALKADLTVACDGRGSALRAAAGMRPRQFGVPIDIWWFRLPKHPDDPQGPRAGSVPTGSWCYWTAETTSNAGTSSARAPTRRCAAAMYRCCATGSPKWCHGWPPARTPSPVGTT